MSEQPRNEHNQPSTAPSGRSVNYMPAGLSDEAQRRVRALRLEIRMAVNASWDADESILASIAADLREHGIDDPEADIARYRDMVRTRRLAQAQAGDAELAVRANDITGMAHASFLARKPEVEKKRPAPNDDHEGHPSSALQLYSVCDLNATEDHYDDDGYPQCGTCGIPGHTHRSCPRAEVGYNGDNSAWADFLCGHCLTSEHPCMALKACRVTQRTPKLLHGISNEQGILEDVKRLFPDHGDFPVPWDQQLERDRKRRAATQRQEAFKPTQPVNWYPHMAPPQKRRKV